MKSLKDYTIEQIEINEGFKDLLKGFWRWLVGKKDEKYNPRSSYYNEKEKVNYINNYSYKSIEIKEIENIKILDEIIKDSLNKEDTKVGFFKLKNYFKENPEYRKINDEYKFLSLIFKTDKLTECCGLIGYTTKYDKLEGKNVVYFVEFLPIYKYLINLNEILKYLQTSIDENIIITDSYLKMLIERENIPTEHVEGQKNAIRLK